MATGVGPQSVLRQIIHEERCQNGEHCHDRHPNEGGILNPKLAVNAESLGVTAKFTKHASSNHPRNEELHHAHAQVAKPCVKSQR